MALSFARHGARHLVVMGRSGFDDNASQTVVQNIQAEGCKIHLVIGDVTFQEDVRRAFKSTAMPVGGIVQGAMVVRVSS
jgi:NAD(P)-dependent dehydrogenase (short-subunit alcohol dehydrogenase family)